MKYASTRGGAPAQSFCDVLLEGLAPDGGLYLPVHYPQVARAELDALREVWSYDGYAALAYEILRRYIDDIPDEDLRGICQRTYTEAVFGSPKITPLQPLAGGLILQNLSGGPTLAFKDMAMQLLGHLFEYELARRNTRLNILGATSGDTGSAAEYAMRGKRGLRVFMLSPDGRMSDFQRAQMYSLQDANIHNIAIKGVFDDCQDLVKAVNADADFKERYRIGAVNSINWARLLAQVVYYFAGYFAATRSNDEQVSFAVPCGNFGNICAGHVARQMGLPIAKLVVATNENDVLDEFFRTGVYRVRAGADTLETSSPSMDISKASNFERFVFDLLGGDTQRVAELFGGRLTRDGFFDLHDDDAFARVQADYGFVSGRCTHAERMATIREVWQQHERMIDPHTANAVKVARQHVAPGVPMLVLETAQPVKFAATMQEALGRTPPRPPEFDGLEALPQRVHVMAPDVAALKAFVAAHSD